MAQACSFPRRREGTQEPGHEGRRYRRPGERRTERAGPKGQTFHGHGEQSAPTGRRAKPPSIHSIFGTSQTCRGCGENEGAWPCHPCRGVGQRPTPAKIPFVYLCGSSCSSCFPQNTPPLSIAPPVARLSRVPFSVLRSPGRLSRPLSARWFGGARRRRSVCWAGRWRRRVRGARAGRWPWPRSEGQGRASPRR